MNKDKNFLNALDDWGSILTDTYEQGLIYVQKSVINSVDMRVVEKEHVNINKPIILTFDSDEIGAIGNEAFADCKLITGELKLPSELTIISQEAFKNCSGISGTVIFPEFLLYLGTAAFLGCSGIDHVVINKHLLEIPGRAFKGCTNLHGELIIPKNVELVLAESFADTNIEILVIESEKLIIDTLAFKNCKGLKGELKLPKGVKGISQSSFNGCSNLTSLLIHNDTDILLDDEHIDPHIHKILKRYN